MMQVGMIVGFFTAWPVNRRLVRSGIKEQMDHRKYLAIVVEQLRDERTREGASDEPLTHKRPASAQRNQRRGTDRPQRRDRGGRASEHCLGGALRDRRLAELDSRGERSLPSWGARRGNELPLEGRTFVVDL
jgi:hypothetical protein